MSGMFDGCVVCFFFFNDTATTEIYTLSLHDALPIFLGALGLACVATFLVGRVAWPLFGGGQSSVADPAADLEREGRRLRRGLILTFVAVAMLALATASGWWPQPEAGSGAANLVAVQVGSGQRVCGALGQAD